MKLFKMIVFLILFSVCSMIANKITHYEYWINSDFSNRVSIEINEAADDYELRETLDLDDLPSGIHSFHVRFKDSTGKWSVAQSSLFYKPIQGKPYPDKSYPSNKIYAFEYWIDSDFANRVSGEALPLDDIYLLRGEMNLENLQSGIHSFHLRFKDSAGKWSVTQSSLFYKPIPSKPYQDKSYQSNKIYGYRWWFDKDFNTKFEIILRNPVDKYATNFNIQCPELETIGDHYLNIQFLDSAGKWSVAQADTFFFEGFVMPKPDLYSPAHTSYVKKDTILDWDVVPYATKYELQVATDTAFTNVIIQVDSTINLNYQLNLDMGQKYFWRVRAYYNNKISDWSEIWMFKTIGLPQINAPEIKKIAANLIRAENNITSDGGSAVTSRGICWNTDGNPTIADNKTTDGTGTGIFQSIATGLTKNTKYYLKGYAANSMGTVYTNETEIQTPDVDVFDINLTSGWNLISSYVEPLEPDSMQYVWEEVSNKLVIAKNNAGAVYIPQFGINSLGKWDVTQGYQVYMNSQTTLSVSGNEVNPVNTGIEIKSGWNTVAYLRNSALSAPLAFASITDNSNLVIAKNQAGQVYIPSFGINSLGDMIPGQGYRIYVTNNDILVYPAN